jgi:hypothetical protein
MNYVTEGLVILSPDDYEFETEDGQLSHWSGSSEEWLTVHDWFQADLDKPGITMVKFNTGVMLRHDETSRIFCLLNDYEPLDPEIKVMTGIFPLLDVWSPVMLNTFWPNGHHIVRKGTPLTRIFISYAGDFKYEHAGDTNYDKQVKPWMQLKESPNILTTFNKEMKKCPFHKG